MAGDLQQVLAELVQKKLDQSSGGGEEKPSHRPLSGLKGVAAGAGVAAAAPLALKHLPKLLERLGVEHVEELIGDPARGLGGLASNLGQSVGSSLGERLEGKIDDAGGPSGILKDTIKSALPFGGESDDDDGSGDGTPGVGKGRRMPVQQSVDIGIPLETVYNQFTQFELWPQFMHRVARLDQEDDRTLAFATKIWGKTKEFTVEIDTQRPDQRIKWHTTGGMTHVGVVTFHELGPNLTRVLVGMDLDPGGMLEKVARGMRLLKRAVRADLHRFKALIETSERETGAWRGTIENGEVSQPHDAKYDKQREYADPSVVLSGYSEDESEEDQDSSGSAAARRSSSSRSASAKSRSKSSSSRSGSSKSRSKSSPRSGSAQSRSKSSPRSGSAQSRSKSSPRSGSAQSRSESSSSRSSQSTRKATASRSPSRQQRRASSSDKPKAPRTTSRRRGSSNGGSGSRSGSRGRGSGSKS